MPTHTIDEMEIKEFCTEALKALGLHCDVIAPPIIKSIMRCGNVSIPNTRHFNWFQRLMWKWCLGVEIKNI